MEPSDKIDENLWRQAIARRQDYFEEKLAVNTSVTQEIKRDTTEMIEMFKSWRGAMKVLGWVSKPVVFITTVIGGIVTVWIAWRAGK